MFSDVMTESAESKKDREAGECERRQQMQFKIVISRDLKAY